MESYPRDFPFGIMDVAELLHLCVRRRQAGSAYVDCPFCDNHRGKMNLNYVKNVWRCNYCGESGGMLALYAGVNHTTKSEAYREICDALQTGEISWGEERKEKTETAMAAYAGGGNGTAEVMQSPRASAQEIHQTLSLLFGMLSLTPAHRDHLRSEKRGLTDEQIDEAGFKSTPPYFLCRSLTERLIRQGCTVQGVPGFYMDDQGHWTVKFHSHYAGILIPAVGIDGLIHGAQILLDVPIPDRGEKPGKSGTKYLWFSSSSRHMGVSSGSPVHFVGNPFARTIYVTEGLLKADIAHYLMNRSFMAVAGANNVSQLNGLFALLAQNGTELIVEAYDMDKYSNQMVANGGFKIYQMARAHGMECRRLTWNPNFKGVDDWQLSLRRKRETPAAPTGNEKQKRQRFRLYQLEFSEGQQTIPFAFRGIAAMRDAGYEQPPAALYHLIHDGEVQCPADSSGRQVLEKLRELGRALLSEGCVGRAVAPSDVIELYDGEQRNYFYVDSDGFEQVKFSPFLARKEKNSAE